MCHKLNMHPGPEQLTCKNHILPFLILSISKHVAYWAICVCDRWTNQCSKLIRSKTELASLIPPALMGSHPSWVQLYSWINVSKCTLSIKIYMLTCDFTKWTISPFLQHHCCFRSNNFLIFFITLSVLFLLTEAGRSWSVHLEEMSNASNAPLLCERVQSLKQKACFNKGSW